MAYSAPANIGELRTVVAAEKPVMVPDDQGGFTTEWVLDFEFMAKVEFWRGGESEIAGKLQSTTYANITARFDNRLTEKHRVVLQDALNVRTEYNVRVVTNFEMHNTWMNVRAERGVGS